MLDVALDVVDLPAGSALVPAPIEVLGDRPELRDQIAGQVLRLQGSSFPIMIRASEPPMSELRAFGPRAFPPQGSMMMRDAAQNRMSIKAYPTRKLPAISGNRCFGCVTRRRGERVRRREPIAVRGVRWWLYRRLM